MPVRLERSHGRWRLVAETRLALPRDLVFPFFADCRNLERITPPALRFRILTPDPVVMGRGARLDYRLRLRGIPFRWRTEITAWEPPSRFVDEQIRGPFRRWVHEHVLEEDGGGTVMRDLVDFAAPGGEAVHRLYVNREVLGIFRYRERAVPALLDAASSPPSPEGRAARSP